MVIGRGPSWPLLLDRVSGESYVSKGSILLLLGWARRVRDRAVVFDNSTTEEAFSLAEAPPSRGSKRRTIFVTSNVVSVEHSGDRLGKGGPILVAEAILELEITRALTVPRRHVGRLSCPSGKHEANMLDLERIGEVSPSRSTVAPVTDQDLLLAKLCQSFKTGNSGALTSYVILTSGRFVRSASSRRRVQPSPISWPVTVKRPTKDGDEDGVVRDDYLMQEVSTATGPGSESGGPNVSLQRLRATECHRSRF
ncbi:hypothetical protein Daesc_008955 [Daldinia eschscholtzii]|uniref:Uncharacterized protein n=1 Tax=Daldinia eschscholtzii TaxID=292717 RepID=A0AAX6M8V4_9PEZI